MEFWIRRCSNSVVACFNWCKNQIQHFCHYNHLHSVLHITCLFYQVTIVRHSWFPHFRADKFPPLFHYFFSVLIYQFNKYKNICIKYTSIKQSEKKINKPAKILSLFSYLGKIPGLFPDWKMFSYFSCPCRNYEHCFEINWTKKLTLKSCKLCICDFPFLFVLSFSATLCLSHASYLIQVI